MTYAEFSAGEHTGDSKIDRESVRGGFFGVAACLYQCADQCFGISGDQHFVCVVPFVPGYATLWEEGAKARIRVDDNRDVYKPHTGLWLGIAASAPNLLLCVLCVLFTLIHQITSVEWCGFAGGVCAVIGRLWQAMYMGILQSIAPGGKYIMLLIPIPAILLCWGAYRLGYGNFRLLGGAKQKK